MTIAKNLMCQPRRRRRLRLYQCGDGTHDDTELARARLQPGRQIHVEPRAPSRAAKRSRPEDDGLLVLRTVKHRERDAFIARRTSAHKPNKKGRELHSIPPEWKDAFAESDAAEWGQRPEYGAVGFLTLRMARTDKHAAARGDKSFAAHLLVAKSLGRRTRNFSAVSSRRTRPP